MVSANAVAYAMLFGWPLVSIILFRIFSPKEAIVWTVLGGYLLLPAGLAVDLPGLPPIDKVLVPSVTVFFLARLFVRKQELTSRIAQTGLRVAKPIGMVGAAEVVNSEDAGQIKTTFVRKQSKIANLLLALTVIGPFFTAATNQDPYSVGPRILPGVTYYDGLSLAILAAIQLIPFIVGRMYLNTREGQEALTKAIVIGAMAYSFLMLIEIRLSPQLHIWLYGYFPHSFAQTVRDGGFRPVVFLGHGLLVAIFTTMAALASLTLYRCYPNKEGKRWLYAGLYLALMLILTKSVGAFVIFMTLAPVLLFLPMRGMKTVLAGMAMIVLVYPMLRSADLLPIDDVLSIASDFSAERAESFQYRVRNEDALLAKANERPLFGWGPWSRYRIYDENSGRDVSTTDGAWIIQFGVNGWTGFIAMFGLLTLPVFLLTRSKNTAVLDLMSAGLCFVLVAKLVDLLPNSDASPILWLIVGSIVGRFEWQRIEPSQGASSATPTAPIRTTGPIVGGKRKPTPIVT